MCPPASVAPAVELNEYWTDEIVLKSLMQLKSGYSLPLNVLSDVDPYQFKPSNLPDIWYFCSGAKEDAEHGFWMSTGEACEIHTNSAIIGLRRTLQFFEGRAPHGQKTNWMMQEYTTTEKYSSKSDPRALCRVFLADDSRLVQSELPLGHRIGGDGATSPIQSGPNTVLDDKHSSGQLSKSELLEKNMGDGTGPSTMANRSPNPAPQNMADIDYVLGGDYLELDDLAEPLSRSSSSTDSSCMTMTSEDFFDSVALLRELGDDTVDQDNQDSRVKFNISAPAKSKEIVMQSTALESVGNGEGDMGETSKTDHHAQNEPEECKNGSNSKTASPKEEKKEDRVGRSKKRKVMKYLCFMAF